ncbi:MAG: ATPase [Oscillatoriales cyanobacterium]|jgi:hypothetical protein|uniref:NB-ARC domain-containing protein n=1 Tax=Microcoleus anatoxicus TaxID=2705319 RepID=UPI002970996E|nr:MAG: ATPase [Oscillatoriales cyanobacterium]TAF61592.1 MAG: ATPase [Oscillatoriales cyanobacterium]
MDVEEILEFADHLVFAMTGKHLDNLQKAILRGAWDNQKYKEIARHHHRSEIYVKEVGFRLWRLLSNVLGEELNKTNFRAALERRWRFSQLLPFWKAFVETNNSQEKSLPSLELLDCQQLDSDISVAYKDARVLSFSPEFTATSHPNLGEAPDISPFYGRTEELTTLKKWIVQERCRLVTLLGMGGIGKTALAVQLVEQIKDKFDCVIWRSLQFLPPLAGIQANLLQFLSNQHPPFAEKSEEKFLALSLDGLLSQSMEYLQKYRCLIVLDDVQMIFSSGKLAGHYQTGYEDYGLLFRRVGELYHNSCLVLLGWDKPREITELEGKNRPCRSMQLQGLESQAAQEILQDKGLVEDEKWEILIDYYQGNPLWLNLVATVIQDFFNGSVSEFWQYSPLFLGEDLKCRLHQEFNRLSDLEKQVMSVLANEPESVSISKLLEQIQIFPTDLLDAVQSLGRRSLISKEALNKGIVFTLGPVVRQYVKTQYARSLR